MDGTMTTIDPTDIPVITEAQANTVLDDVIDSIIQVRTEDGAEVEVPAIEKLKRTFGDAAPLVARMVMLGTMRGFDLGLVEATPGSDRTDILAAELRRVHAKEQFGDCVEDGEVWPCQTVKMLNLVAGAPEPEEPLAEEGAVV